MERLGPSVSRPYAMQILMWTIDVRLTDDVFVTSFHKEPLFLEFIIFLMWFDNLFIVLLYFSMEAVVRIWAPA